jgi:hypothetical protein
MNETKKHPLYKNVISLLEEQGVNYQTVLKVTWLEDQLQAKYKTPQFNGAIIQIRKHFIHQGMYLTCRGQHDEQFVFGEPRYNHALIQGMQAKAFRALKSGYILGTNTPSDLMDPESQKLHDRALEQIALRLMFMKKPQAVLKVVGAELSQKKLAS